MFAASSLRTAASRGRARYVCQATGRVARLCGTTVTGVILPLHDDGSGAIRRPRSGA